MDEKTLGYTYEELIDVVLFYNMWKSVVDEPEFSALRDKVRLRELKKDAVKIKNEIVLLEFNIGKR